MIRSNGTTKKKQPQPEFVLRAERAFRRVARKLQCGEQAHRNSSRGLAAEGPGKKKG